MRSQMIQDQIEIEIEWLFVVWEKRLAEPHLSSNYFSIRSHKNWECWESGVIGCVYAWESACLCVCACVWACVWACKRVREYLHVHTLCVCLCVNKASQINGCCCDHWDKFSFISSLNKLQSSRALRLSGLIHSFHPAVLGSKLPLIIFFRTALRILNCMTLFLWFPNVDQCPA